jgi:hypothetical protein
LNSFLPILTQCRVLTPMTLYLLLKLLNVKQVHQIALEDLS